MKPIAFVNLTFVCLGLSSFLNLHADEGWDGGSGTWDFNTTPNWNGTSTWTSNSQQAYFPSSPGTITVDNSEGQVGANQLAFYGTNTTGDWTVKTATLPSSTLPNGSLALDGSQNEILFNSYNSGSVTIDSNLTVDTTRPTDRYNIYDSSGYTGNNTFTGPGGVLNLNGNITFTGVLDANHDNPGRSLIVGSTNNNTVINLNGTYIDASAGGGPALELRLGEGGADQMTYNLNGNFVGLTNGISIGEGNVNISPSAVLGTHGFYIYNDSGFSGQNSALYGVQGVSISNNAYFSAKYDFSTGSTSRYGFGTEGVSDNSSVTFSGGIGLDSTSLILNAVTGGRATITDTDYTNGQYNGSIYGSAPTGLSKTGAGTVVLSTFNTYNTFADSRDNADAGTVAMDIKAGTLLITNTTGSAFGNGNQYYNSSTSSSVPDTTTVNVESKATLGGTGISTQNVVSEAADAVLAPGDSGADHGTAAIGTLHLNGGLTAANGLTMDFKLNGLANDSIDFGGNTLNLNGPITINLTGTPTVSAVNDGIFKILTGLNLNNLTQGDDLTYTFNAPVGYQVVDFGSEAGPVNTTGQDYIYVQLAATPEPSTYALLLGGLGLLVAMHRFRRLSA